MVTLTGVFNSMFEILKALVPVGVEPFYFWATLLISFGIIFLLLQLLPLFKDSRGIAFIVAVVISYFVASSAVATIVIAKLFPNVGIALMAILGLLLVIAFLAPGSFDGGLKYTPIIAIIAFIFIIVMTYSAVAPELQRSGYISESMGTNIQDSDIAMIIAAIIVIGIVWMIITPNSKTGTGFGREFFRWAGGKGW